MNNLERTFRELFPDETINPPEVKLTDKYPLIFEKTYLEIDKGWHSLVDTLCFQIQSYIDSTEKRRASAIKWNESIHEVCNYRVVLTSIPQVVATQVKEKFGGLRFYYNGGDEFIEGLVQMAEEFSYKICEKCGNAGKLRNKGWIRTLCDEHV